MFKTVYVISAGKVRETQARIAGEFAYIQLPFNQEKPVKLPNWQPTKVEAEAEIVRRKVARVERARKIVAGAEMQP